MAWPRRSLALFAVGALAAALIAASTSPPPAKANVACDKVSSPVAPITGALGHGNPLGDACDKVTGKALDALPDPLAPLKDAAGSIGSGIFEQIASWSAEGATWLMGRVAALAVKSTSPNLLSEGFGRQYRQMARIAAVLAVLMVILACVESLGRGDGAMLWRVLLVNVPVAALATSAAYVVVQLLIATTDGFSEAVAHATASDMRDFFKSAIESLSSAGAKAGSAAPDAGAAGAVAVPLFVSFIAAVVAAVAAFLVWVELLMRDAAIYAVALFMPLAIAASIWPRWSGALRRTAELVIVVVFSKFVIVSIIALAASLLANTGGKVEHVLAAGALLLLACFAPFVLFRLVPFAEGAVSSAFSRPSAAGASVRSVEFASSVQMMRRAALANWALDGTQAGGSSGAGGGSAGARRGGGGNGGGGGTGGGQAAGASAGAAGTAALAAGASAVKTSQAAAGRLAGSGTAQASGPGSGESADASQVQAAPAGPEAVRRPPAQPGAQRSEAAHGGEQRPASAEGAPSSQPGSAPEPRPASGGGAASSGAKPPRPAGEVRTAGKGKADAGKDKP